MTDAEVALLMAMRRIPQKQSHWLELVKNNEVELAKSLAARGFAVHRSMTDERIGRIEQFRITTKGREAIIDGIIKRLDWP